MFGFYASDYYRGKIEEILLKSLDRKFHMPKYRKSVVRVFTDLLHSIQETVNNETVRGSLFDYSLFLKIGTHLMHSFNKDNFSKLLLL